MSRMGWYLMKSSMSSDSVTGRLARMPLLANKVRRFRAMYTATLMLYSPVSKCQFCPRNRCQELVDIVQTRNFIVTGSTVIYLFVNLQNVPRGPLNIEVDVGRGAPNLFTRVHRGLVRRSGNAVETSPIEHVQPLCNFAAINSRRLPEGNYPRWMGFIEDIDRDSSTIRYIWIPRDLRYEILA